MQGSLCLLVRNGDKIFILVFVSEQQLLIWVKCASKDALHHQHQLVVSEDKFRKRSTVFILREVVIVDRDPSDVLAKGGLDDQLARQIKLVEAPLHLGTKSYLCKSLNIMFWNSKYQLSCYSSSVDIYWTEWTWIHHGFRGGRWNVGHRDKKYNWQVASAQVCSSHAKNWSLGPAFWTSGVPFSIRLLWPFQALPVHSGLIRVVSNPVSGYQSQLSPVLQENVARSLLRVDPNAIVRDNCAENADNKMCLRMSHNESMFSFC